MGRKPMKGRCPTGEPHHWMIDSQSHGVCMLCKAERDFPGDPDYGHTREVSRKGGLVKVGRSKKGLW